MVMATLCERECKGSNDEGHAMCHETISFVLINGLKTIFIGAGIRASNELTFCKQINSNDCRNPKEKKLSKFMIVVAMLSSPLF